MNLTDPASIMVNFCRRKTTEISAQTPENHSFRLDFGKNQELLLLLTRLEHDLLTPSATQIGNSTGAKFTIWAAS